MNTYFQFKQFTIQQAQCAMKVSTDACLFGAWVTHFLKEQSLQSNLKILDIGAGTGLLSLMIRQELECQVTAVELDAAAAAQCSGNFHQTPWSPDLNALEGDIRQFSADLLFDCIVSNPPFFADDLHAPGKERNQARHEQSLSLHSLLQTVIPLISTSGWLFLLYPSRRLEEVLEEAAAFQLYPAQIVSVRHSEKHPVSRYFFAFRPQPAETIRSTLLIRDASGAYSADFIRLLQPYYLDRLLNPQI